MILGTVTVTVPEATTETIKLSLNATGRSLLQAAHGHLSVNLLVLKSSPSPSRRSSTRVKLVEPRP